MNSVHDNFINIICDKCQSRLPDDNLDKEDYVSLIWDVITRVLNANIGRMVKQCRQQKLTRVNDVSFRKRIAVKCQSKMI